jgi:hypothetical protein
MDWTLSHVEFADTLSETANSNDFNDAVAFVHGEQHSYRRGEQRSHAFAQLDAFGRGVFGQLHVDKLRSRRAAFRFVALVQMSASSPSTSLCHTTV